MRSQAPELAAVVERLDKLERQNRRLKLMGVMVLALAAAGLLMGQTGLKGRTVEAERFVLKDAKGAIRATLGMEGQNDGSLLQFYGNDRKAYAALGVLVDSQATMATTLLLGAKRNPDGEGGHLLAVISNFDSSLVLSYGKIMASLRAANEGVVLGTSDKVGRVGISLSQGADGVAGIFLLDKTGRAVWKAP